MKSRIYPEIWGRQIARLGFALRRSPGAPVSRWMSLVRQGEGPLTVADTVTAVRRRARTVTRVSDVPSRVRMLRMVIDSILEG